MSFDLQNRSDLTPGKYLSHGRFDKLITVNQASFNLRTHFGLLIPFTSNNHKWF